jgi:subtilisin family serine protease
MLQDENGDGLITIADLNARAANGSYPDQGIGKITAVHGGNTITAADILAPMVTVTINGRLYDTGRGGWAYAGNTQDGDTAHPNDFIGWNFVTNTNNPMDDFGHGTHVSGTIAAEGNNGTGVAGVDWNVQVMPVKFLDSSGYGSVSNFIQGLDYAVEHGAKISNNSWSGASWSQALYDAVNNARNYGVIVVAAAGNDGSNNDTNPTYPASLPLDNVVAVAATDQNNNLASFSNYGPRTVDLAAPGVNILSTLPGGGYGLDSGTSMATPHVSGALALVWSEHPNWTYTQVINQVLNTVDRLPSLSGRVSSGGMLDLAAAVGWVEGAGVPPAVTGVQPVEPNPSTLTGITVTFNQAMNPSTINAGNISLVGPSGQTYYPQWVSAVSGSGNKSFTIGFNTLTAQGSYYLTLGTGIRSNSGTPLPTAYKGVYTLNGSAPSTTAPPAVTNVRPIEPNPNTLTGITVTFNQAMNPSTVNAGTITLVGPNGKTYYPQWVNAGSGNTSFTIGFNTLTAPGSYYLTLSTGIRSNSGAALPSAYKGVYTLNGSAPSTGGAPAVANVQPIEPNSGTLTGITVTFNQAMNPSTINSGTVTLVGPNGQTYYPQWVNAGSGNASFTIGFGTLTAPGTYHLKLSTGIRSNSGAALPSAFQAGYSLAGSSTNSGSPPGVTSVQPVEPNPSTLTGITVNFNQAMNPATINSGTVTLVGPNGQTYYPQWVKAEPGNTSFTIGFNTLTAQGNYYLTLGTGIRSNSGTALPSAFKGVYTLR